MNKEIEKIISNNCGMQDGAILTEYITNLQQRIDKAIEIIKLCDTKCAKELLEILGGINENNNI